MYANLRAQTTGGRAFERATALRMCSALKDADVLACVAGADRLIWARRREVTQADGAEAALRKADEMTEKAPARCCSDGPLRLEGRGAPGRWRST